jgi:DNA repair protein RadD
MDISLYPYQLDAVEQLRRNIRDGTRTQILAAPTGSGKTVIASYLIDECHKKGKRAVMVCDRIPLIDQTSTTFDLYGIPHGVIQAQHWRRQPDQRVQVASAQTLARRKWPPADLIIVDEAHTIHRNVTDRIAKRDTVVIGLTATPFTRGLGKMYDAVVSVTTTNKLIEDGFLAPYRIFAASEPDMTGAKVVAGEWTDEAAAERAMPIVGDVVSEYLKHCDGLRFIAFGVNTAHCAEMQRRFMEAGVPCALYTYRTSDEERAELVRDFKASDGHLRGLISVSALAKGFDVASVGCIIMARPLRTSLAEHIQIWGRGLRVDPNNPAKVCTILDHAGNVARLWEPTMDFFANGATSLDDGRKRDKKKAEKKQPEPMKCPKCAAVHAPRPMCVACGYEYPRRNKVHHIDGELHEFGGSVTTTDRRDLHAQLLWIARERGYAEGWAARTVKDRTGQWPKGDAPDPMEPSPDVRNYVRSRMIAWAKSKRRAVA